MTKPAAPNQMITPAAPKLLSGGNPQIAKGAGPGPVAAYLAAMPGWKAEAGQRLDALICQEVPGVAKAVKWNTPLYGVTPGLWFLSFHCFAAYIKVTFFRGAQLTPPPPEGSKYPQVRYFHIREGVPFEDEMRTWVEQAKLLPGEKL